MENEGSVDELTFLSLQNNYYRRIARVCEKSSVVAICDFNVEEILGADARAHPQQLYRMTRDQSIGYMHLSTGSWQIDHQNVNCDFNKPPRVQNKSRARIDVQKPSPKGESDVGKGILPSLQDRGCSFLDVGIVLSCGIAWRIQYGPAL